MKISNQIYEERAGMIYKCNEVNEYYTRFLHIFNEVSNIHATLKRAKINHKAYKPWITSGLKKSMKVRDKLYKKWLITRNYVFLNKYKLYRNKIAIINKIYRDCFYNDILIKSDNTKKIWNNINLLINKKRPSSHKEKLQVDNKRYEQPLTISNCLNEFFCNVPSTLAAQLPKSDKSATSYLSQKQKQFRFTEVSEIEVFLLLGSLDTNKSFGVDKIHPLLLKTAALQIYRPLTFIFNLSINQGIFPDNMKLAKVVPVFKQGSRFACSNYRSILVLSSISKIFERLIINQLIFYFTNNNMISSKQYGFRPGFTTSDCLIDLIE